MTVLDYCKKCLGLNIQDIFFVEKPIQVYENSTEEHKDSTKL